MGKGANTGNEVAGTVDPTRGPVRGAGRNANEGRGPAGFGCRGKIKSLLEASLGVNRLLAGFT